MAKSKIISEIEGIGTYWHIEIFDKDLDVEKVRSRITHEIKDFEQKYSRFKNDSWLTQLNTNRIFTNADREFIELLEIGIDFYNKTESVFNIGLGKKLEQIGYNKNYELQITNYEFVKAPDLDRLIRIRKNTIELIGEGNIDFGGIGKGFLIDKLARILQKDYGLEFYVINGGGDIYVTSDHDQEVEIFLQNPRNPSEILDKVVLKNCSVCGSSPHLRKWKDAVTGEEFTHILDPEEKTQITKSTFVIAENTLTADILATTLIIRNDISFIKSLKKHFSFGYQIIE